MEWFYSTGSIRQVYKVRRLQVQVQASGKVQVSYNYLLELSALPLPHFKREGRGDRSVGWATITALGELNAALGTFCIFCTAQFYSASETLHETPLCCNALQCHVVLLSFEENSNSKKMIF